MERIVKLKGNVDSVVAEVLVECEKPVTQQELRKLADNNPGFTVAIEYLRNGVWERSLTSRTIDRRRTEKVVTLLTTLPDMRAKVEGWGGEDPDLLVRGKPIGLTPSPRFPLYETVLHALADGWRLLGPPQEDNSTQETTYTWWLVK